ncbi:MAG: hypothetical protein Q7S74_03985 [Nanoarchaeota archaeon]|nr:hypothetical protein [Nanoarchaeota archaeon]
MTKMVLDIAIFSGPWITFWVSLAVACAAIIILKLIERRLKNKLEEKRREKGKFFHNELEAIHKNKNKENAINLLDINARQFFIQAYGLSKSLSYTERIDKLSKTDRLEVKSAITFCDHLQEAMYSGQKIDIRKINNLINEFEGVIQVYRKTVVKSFREEKHKKIRVGNEILNLENNVKEGFSELPKVINEFKMEVRKISKEVVDVADNKFIRSFDDLERIKSKINQSKRNNYKEHYRSTHLF